MNADGSNQTQLTFDAQPKDQVPDWSPDGSKIAYLSDTHGVADLVNPSWGDIWVMNADGTGQHPITTGATYYGTAWSPDGTRIATVNLPIRTVVTIDSSNGADAQAVHPGPGLQYVPGWQPRGTGADGEDERYATRATLTAAVVTTTIKVTTFNSSYHLSAKTAPRGVVIFKVTNAAHFGHDFSINGQTTKVLKTGRVGDPASHLPQAGPLRLQRHRRPPRSVGRHWRLHDHLGDTRTRGLHQGENMDERSYSASTTSRRVAWVLGFLYETRRTSARHGALVEPSGRNR